MACPAGAEEDGALLLDDAEGADSLRFGIRLGSGGNLGIGYRQDIRQVAIPRSRKTIAEMIPDTATPSGSGLVGAASTIISTPRTAKPKKNQVVTCKTRPMMISAPYPHRAVLSKVFSEARLIQPRE